MKRAFRDTLFSATLLVPLLAGAPALAGPASTTLPDSKAGRIPVRTGTDWSYSNAGYVLLGRIIEKVSGESYFDYAEQHIFAPSKMVASEYDTQEDVTPKLATGHLREGDFAATWKANWLTLPSKGSPAGGGYSTKADLRGGKLVREETLNAMFADSVPPGRSPRRKNRLPSIACRPLCLARKPLHPLGNAR